MAKNRIYRVSAKKPDGPKSRLVEATGKSDALKHVVEDTLVVDFATQMDLVALVAQGVKVEQTTAVAAFNPNTSTN